MTRLILALASLVLVTACHTHDDEPALPIAVSTSPEASPLVVEPGQKAPSKAVKQSNKERDIRVLLEITGSAKLGKQSMEFLVESFTQSMPDVPKKFWEEFMKEVDEDDLINLIVPIYDKHFTHEDIKELIEFYKSPAGKKSVDLMPQIMQESQIAGQKWGAELGQKIQKRLQSSGYSK